MWRTFRSIQLLSFKFCKVDFQWSNNEIESIRLEVTTQRILWFICKAIITIESFIKHALYKSWLPCPVNSPSLAPTKLCFLAIFPSEWCGMARTLLFHLISRLHSLSAILFLRSTYLLIWSRKKLSITHHPSLVNIHLTESGKQALFDKNHWAWSLLWHICGINVIGDKWHVELLW